MIEDSVTYIFAHHTDEENCEWLKAMDDKFGTYDYSPLHHNNRCRIKGHRKNNG